MFVYVCARVLRVYLFVGPAAAESVDVHDEVVHT